MKPRAPSSRIACVVLPALLTGCYTTTNVVTVPPLQTKHPVSASGQYVDASGTIVKEGEYDVVHSFSFDSRVEGPRHQTSDNTLALEAKLNELLAQHQGDAMTDVTIAATEYDIGSHGSAASWKILGWTFGLTGATFTAAGVMLSDDGGSGDILVPMGLVFMGLGAVGFLAAGAADDPAAWQFHVEGNVVKRNGAAPAAAPASSAAEPNSAQEPNAAQEPNSAQEPDSAEPSPTAEPTSPAP